MQNKDRTDLWFMSKNDPKKIIQRVKAMNCPYRLVDRMLGPGKNFTNKVFGTMVSPEQYEELNELMTALEKEGFQYKTPPSTFKLKKIIHRGKKCQGCGQVPGDGVLRNTVADKESDRGKIKNTSKQLCNECFKAINPKKITLESRRSKVAEKRKTVDKFIYIWQRINCYPHNDFRAVLP